MLRTFLIALFAALPLPTTAQDKEVSRVEFRVTRFDPGDQPPPEFRAGTGAAQIELSIPLTYIGGPHTVSLRDGSYLDFFRGDDDIKPEISLQIADDERKDLLLFFFPVGETFKVMKVSTPLTRIRGSDRYLLNLTSNPLAVKIGGDKPVLIESGKSGLLQGPRGAETVSLPVLISSRQDDDWKLVSTENWHFDPRFRSYLFVFISPRTHHPAFHVISERL